MFQKELIYSRIAWRPDGYIKKHTCLSFKIHNHFFTVFNLFSSKCSLSVREQELSLVLSHVLYILFCAILMQTTSINVAACWTTENLARIGC